MKFETLMLLINCILSFALLIYVYWSRRNLLDSLNKSIKESKEFRDNLLNTNNTDKEKEE